MRDATLVATFPAVGLLLIAIFILLPKQFTTPMTVWLLLEALIACGLALFYILQRKYRIGKTYPLFFLVLLASLFIVISYIPSPALFYAYVVTTVVTLFIYLRILREIHRRGYI
ncbi:MAG: hypothetical protein ABSD99_02145 [Candidatus Bathyarchaeia archaeon]